MNVNSFIGDYIYETGWSKLSHQTWPVEDDDVLPGTF